MGNSSKAAVIGTLVVIVGFFSWAVGEIRGYNRGSRYRTEKPILRDLNGDGREDIILYRYDGEHDIYLQQKNGKFKNIWDAEREQRESIESQVPAYSPEKR